MERPEVLNFFFFFLNGRHPIPDGFFFKLQNKSIANSHCSCLAECYNCFTVKLQKCLVDYETSDFASAWREEMTDFCFSGESFSALSLALQHLINCVYLYYIDCQIL